MKGKKILTTFLAGALALTTLIGDIEPVHAAGEEKNQVAKLKISRFFDADGSVSGGDASITYADGYWAEEGQSYRPLWLYKTDESPTGWAMVQPDYFRTEDGKVAYCIEPAKDSPDSVTMTDEQVSKKIYGVIKAGYPSKQEDSNDSGVSDIELEWATTWAVKAAAGGTSSFDEYAMTSSTSWKDQAAKVITAADVTVEDADSKTQEEIEKETAELIAAMQKAEDERVAKINEEGRAAADEMKASAEKIREVAESLAATDAVQDYDKYEVDASEAKAVHEGGIYKIGPYKVVENVGGSTSVKLENAPANASVLEDAGSYYVSIPEGSLTKEVKFNMVFTGDKQLLSANVYTPADDSEQKMFICEMTDAKASVEITAKPEVIKGGQIRMFKKDADGNTPLEGVEFEVFNTKNELVDTIVTNANGEATSKVLPYGSYTVVESKALSGYILSKESMRIVLNETSASDISLATRTVTNKKNVVEITKVGSDTNKPLEGATLVVKDNAGKEIFSGKTDKTGKITLTGIAAGKYTVSESEAPKGYVKTAEVISFSIDEYGVVTGTTTLKNDPLKNVVIKKVGEDDEKKGLEGAMIEVRDSANNVILKDKTNKNGELTIPSLAPGKYTYVEVEAPKGYALNTEKHTFEVTAKGEVTGTLVIKDKPIVVEIKKTSTDGSALEGATIQVKNCKKETVYNGKTNANGIVTIEKLVPGTYTFTETAPPAGYKLNTKSFTFKVDEYGKVSGTTTIEDEITVVTITKKDKADNKVLAGAKITVKDSNGKVVAEGKTDENGKFVVMGLAPGTYVYTEDEAPNGYIKTNERATFTINSKGEDVSLTLYNSKLQLQTTNKGTGTTTNGKGEIIKTGVDDTTKSMIPVYILIAGAAAAVAVVIVRKKAKH